MPLKVIFSSSVCHKSVLSLLTSRCFQLVECLMCTSRINFIHRQMQFLQLFENSNFLQMDTSHTHMPASKSREDLVNFLGKVLSANSGGELREGEDVEGYTICFHSNAFFLMCVNASGPDLFQSQNGQVWIDLRQITYHIN